MGEVGKSRMAAMGEELISQGSCGRTTVVSGRH